MKHSSVIVMLVAMVAIGCSHNVSQPNVPEPKHERAKPAMTPDQDQESGFNKYCQGVHDGSKYVWNKTTQAYEWATSEETKKSAGEYYDSAKSAASRAYDATKRGIEAVSNDAKK